MDPTMLACFTALRILFTGDSSIAEAYLPIEQRLSSLVAVELGSETVNLGVGGSSSLDWLWWESSSGSCEIQGGCYGLKVVPALPADVIVHMTGINDATGFQESGPTIWHEYFGALHEILVGFGGPVFFITPPTIPQNGFHIAAYRERIFDLVSLHPNAYLGADAWASLVHPIHFIDAVHLNALGASIVADELIQSIIDSGICGP